MKSPPLASRLVRLAEACATIEHALDVLRAEGIVDNRTVELLVRGADLIAETRMCIDELLLIPLRALHDGLRLNREQFYSLRTFDLFPIPDIEFQFCDLHYYRDDAQAGYIDSVPRASDDKRPLGFIDPSQTRDDFLNTDQRATVLKVLSEEVD